MKIRLNIEYKGTNFSGWQIQPGVRTIQEELEKGINVILTSQFKQKKLNNISEVTVVGSGRTDAGVHALCQVCSFDWPQELDFEPVSFTKSLNGITDRDIIISSSQAVSESFDARRTPHIKTYEYRINTGNAWGGLYDEFQWTPEVSNLDVRKMIFAAGVLLGEHDFETFRASDCCATSTNRTIKLSDVVRTGKHELTYIVQGNGFLKQMVRIIVGTLVDVGAGKVTLDNFREILESKNRSNAGQTAPAKGLCLKDVRYLESY